MGAHDISRDLPGTLTQTEVKQAFDKWHVEDRQYHGEDPYSGSWATIRYVTFPTSDVFQDMQAAHNYCMDKSQKWEFACAVKYVHVTKKRKKAPTFVGKPPENEGIIGKEPVVVRTYPRPGDSRLIAADQLSEPTKIRLVELMLVDQREGRNAGETQQALHTYLLSLEKPETTFEPGRVRALRQAAFAATKRFAATHTKLTELTDKHRQRLYAYDETRETRWLVCGWAAS